MLKCRNMDPFKRKYTAKGILQRAMRVMTKAGIAKKTAISHVLCDFKEKLENILDYIHGIGFHTHHEGFHGGKTLQ
jgi:hypothetical protein